MSSARLRVKRIALCLALVSGLAVAPIHADDIDKQVQAATEELDRASKKVTEARKSLKEATAKLPAARAKLNTATAAETKARTVYQGVANRLAATQKAYQQSRAKVIAKQQEIDALQVKVNQFARAVYQQGQTSQWEIILQSESPSDLADRMQTIRSVSQASASSLHLLNVAKDQLKIAAHEVAVKRAQVAVLTEKAKERLIEAENRQNQAAQAKAYVDRLVAQRDAALRISWRDKKEVWDDYVALRKEQLRIAKESSSGSSGSNDPQATGPLSWPLQPSSSYPAGQSPGWRVHPVYGYRSCHTGQDIPAGAGTPIHAAAAGIVLSVSYNQVSGGRSTTPYGNVTLVDHGGGVVTMYAHQSRFAVSPGDRVAAGEVIGYVGTTGWSTGPHLHFEVHINGVPYMPLGWFGNSRRPVPCWSGG